MPSIEGHAVLFGVFGQKRMFWNIRLSDIALEKIRDFQQKFSLSTGKSEGWRCFRVNTVSDGLARVQ